MRSALVLALVVAPNGSAAVSESLVDGWPSADAVGALAGQVVRFPSQNPFSLRDVGADAPAIEAVGHLFLPADASPAAPVPAVVLIHGAGGVLFRREPLYARQLAAMGIAALIVDAFGARADMARGFTERLIQITETMLIADVYAALRYLDGLPEVDGDRVALIGFSYGGMAATYAAHVQVAERFAPNGARFAGHVAFYAPCLAQFEDGRSTGAPVLFLIGDGDAIVDQARCAEVVAGLTAGGAEVETIVYEGAYHQWDGSFSGPRPIGRNLADCRLRVERSGVARDTRTFLPMTNPLARRIILALCVRDEGYLIGRDDDVRTRSNRDLGRFLRRIFHR